MAQDVADVPLCGTHPMDDHDPTSLKGSEAAKQSIEAARKTLEHSESTVHRVARQIQRAENLVVEELEVLGGVRRVYRVQGGEIPK